MTLTKPLLHDRPQSKLQESHFKKPTNLNFGTIDQSAALIQLHSQSKVGLVFFGNISFLDLTVLCDVDKLTSFHSFDAKDKGISRKSP